MTKAELMNKVKMLEQINEELDISLDKALNQIKVLKEVIKETLTVDNDLVTMDDLDGMTFSEDGELSKEGLVMLIKSGMGQGDVQKLIDKGDEIIEWLKKKGIKLDSGGNLDKN